MDQPVRITLRFPLSLMASLWALPAAFAAAADEPRLPDPPTPARESRIGAMPPGPFLVAPQAPLVLRSGAAASSLQGPFLPDPPAVPGALASTTAPSASGAPRPPNGTRPSARGTGGPGRDVLVRQAASAPAPTSFDPSAFDLDVGPSVDGRTPGEPSLGAALDGPAESVGPLEEHRRRLARHGAWLGSVAPTENARQLLERVADAGAHGLDPARYDLEGLREGVAALFAGPRPDGPWAPYRLPVPRERARLAGSVPIEPDSPARAALVYRFDRAFSRLAKDLGRGLVDARSVQRRLYRDPPDPDVALLRESLALGHLDVAGALDSVAPTHERYARLVETMRALLAEREAGTVRTRVDVSGTLAVGDHDPDVMRVKRRLVETGELPRDAVVTPMFDGELVLAVEAFRHRHGLPPGGAVDRAVRRALNRTLDEELDDLALSLERWRWMPRELGERHLFVNLPDYRLTFDNGAQRIVDMPVVIGATEHPTPSFSREMSYLEFNPTWTVPPKITRRELLPIERRSPGYLESRNFDFMEVVDGRLEKVPFDSVSRRDLDQRPFPYYLRQRGGPGNALGRMKFMMPNPYAIYLHDTQARHLFARHERAYSHGCIRLSDPERLAKLVLQIDGRGLDEAERLIGSRETRRAGLRNPLPTHLAYFTTWVDREGAVQRRADVYGHDEALREALRANGALPSARLARVEAG